MDNVERSFLFFFVAAGIAMIAASISLIIIALKTPLVIPQ